MFSSERRIKVSKGDLLQSSDWKQFPKVIHAFKAITAWQRCASKEKSSFPNAQAAASKYVMFIQRQRMLWEKRPYELWISKLFRVGSIHVAAWKLRGIWGSTRGRGRLERWEVFQWDNGQWHWIFMYLPILRNRIWPPKVSLQKCVGISVVLKLVVRLLSQNQVLIFCTLRQYPCSVHVWKGTKITLTVKFFKSLPLKLEDFFQFPFSMLERDFISHFPSILLGSHWVGSTFCFGVL